MDRLIKGRKCGKMNGLINGLENAEMVDRPDHSTTYNFPMLNFSIELWNPLWEGWLLENSLGLLSETKGSSNMSQLKVHHYKKHQGFSGQTHKMATEINNLNINKTVKIWHLHSHKFIVLKANRTVKMMAYRFKTIISQNTRSNQNTLFFHS